MLRAYVLQIQLHHFLEESGQVGLHDHVAERVVGLPDDARIHRQTQCHFTPWKGTMVKLRTTNGENMGRNGWPGMRMTMNKAIKVHRCEIGDVLPIDKRPLSLQKRSIFTHNRPELGNTNF